MIGPHEGKELTLMREGSKNLAFFCGMPSDIPVSFHPLITNALEQDIFYYCHLKYFHVFYVRGKKKEALRLAELVSQVGSDMNAEIETEIGRLLGYNEEDIADYLAKVYPDKVDKNPKN